jgi:hypothetical protein
MSELSEKFIELSKQVIATGQVFLKITEELDLLMIEIDKDPDTQKEIKVYPDKENLIEHLGEITYKLKQIL